MSRPKLEVADIFRAHGDAYRRDHAGHLTLLQLKVMSAIETCRTAALGGLKPTGLFGKLSISTALVWPARVSSSLPSVGG